MTPLEIITAGTGILGVLKGNKTSGKNIEKREPVAMTEDQGVLWDDWIREN